MAWTKQEKPTGTYTKEEKPYDTTNYIFQDGNNFIFQDGNNFVFSIEIEGSWNKVAKPT